MARIDVRKIVLGREDTWHDGGQRLPKPRHRAWIAAVVANPYAGRHVADITPMMDALKPLGIELSTELITALGGRAQEIDAYGKGAIVGVNGEIEHTALWHVPGGYAMRERLGKALAIVPSTVKMGGAGTTLDLPLHHKDAAYVRSHFDTVTAMIADGPRPDEIAFFLCMAIGGRPHARVGGLTIDDIAKWDGQR